MKEKKWIPPKEKDRLRDRNAYAFRKIKKTTQTGLGASSSQPVDDHDKDEELSGEDDSYYPSDEDALPITSMDAFQIKMWDAFEQFWLTQVRMN